MTARRTAGLGSLTWTVEIKLTAPDGLAYWAMRKSERAAIEADLAELSDCVLDDAAVGEVRTHGPKHVVFMDAT